MDEQPLTPTTTSEQNLRTAGQRKINLIWEYSQAAIALSVVAATIIYAFSLLFLVNPPANSILTSAFFLVIGFYFGRTNHARIGDSEKLDDR